MKYPLWLLNSILFFLCILFFGYLFFSRQKMPTIKNKTPISVVAPIARENAQINIEKIYENDLFGTYVKKKPALEIAEERIVFPEPPAPRPETITPPVEPQFLDPLKVVLKGIISFAQDSLKNKAIIADESTGQETSMAIGDSIEDAKLIKIFYNKVIFIRSNGQQEILYLREKDTKADPVYADIIGWGAVVTENNRSTYTIHVDKFLSRVASVVQVIDMLDMSPAYKEGKAIGMHIGNIAHNSLGHALGLEKGDIVVAINAIPATTSGNRLTIYKSIVATETNNKPIEVVLLRGNNPLILSYILDFEQRSASAEKDKNSARMQNQVKNGKDQQENTNMLTNLTE